MGPKAFWVLLCNAGSSWLAHNAPRLGAALAYYTIFSIAPLLVIAIAIAGYLFGRKAVEGQIAAQFQELFGKQGAEAIQAMLTNAGQPNSGLLPSLLGGIVLVIGAIGLFIELHSTMNTVCGVQVKSGRGILGFLRDRLLAFFVMLGSILILCASVVLSAVLATISNLPGGREVVFPGQLVHLLSSVLVLILLFAMIFRFVPDARIAWRDVWLGATTTALLFTLGKMLIGLYLGHAGVGSAYGAAGSLVVLLVWLYYSAQIFLFGAELTKAFAERYGSGVSPGPNAERTPEPTQQC
jgi:membrane protein